MILMPVGLGELNLSLNGRPCGLSGVPQVSQVEALAALGLLLVLSEAAEIGGPRWRAAMDLIDAYRAAPGHGGAWHEIVNALESGCRLRP